MALDSGSGLLILDTTLKKLELVLGANATTNQPTFSVSFADTVPSSYSSGGYDPRANMAGFSPSQAVIFKQYTVVGETDDTTPVTLVDAPLQRVVKKKGWRQVKLLTIHNEDTADNQVVIRFNDNGAFVNIHKATLITGYSLLYLEGRGFQLLDDNFRTVSASFAPGP